MDWLFDCPAQPMRWTVSISIDFGKNEASGLGMDSSNNSFIRFPGQRRLCRIEHRNRLVA